MQHFLEIKRSLYQDGGLNSHLRIHSILHRISGHICMINGNPNARLIITAVNVLSAEPLIFDSTKQQITSRHILATTGYPSYYFRWVEVEKEYTHGMAVC